MTCYSPLEGWYSKKRTLSGNRKVVFNLHEGLADRPVTIPCGQCIGCRLERSRQWAVRCVHEASLHTSNCFLTLTFSNIALLFLHNLDKRNPNSLVKSDFQKFIKRLRKKINLKVRYFHCGEYGGMTQRPHHHCILFGYDFPDKKFWSARRGVPLYRSAELERLWSIPISEDDAISLDPKYIIKELKHKSRFSSQYQYYLKLGFCTIGEVSFESCAYVARYIMKKQLGKDSETFYSGRVPDYNTMSRRPGIAHGWIEKYYDDVYPQDYVTIRNDIKCKPPKYYDYYYKLTNYLNYDFIKNKRIAFAKSPKALELKQRNYVRLKCKQIAIKSLVRAYESTV